MPRSTPARSLNPELLMREFTQDEQGRIDSLGNQDSPSGCFQSQFAREVVQNTRRSSSVLILDSNNQPEVWMMKEAEKLKEEKNKRRSSVASSKYRSQFAAKYHQVSF